MRPSLRVCLERIDALLLLWSRAPLAVRWTPLLVIFTVLWWSSSRSPAVREPDHLRAFLHNGMHVVAYAGLGACAWFVIPGGAGARRWVGCVVVALVYGIVDEVHQSYVPGRACSVADVLTDVCGAAMAGSWLHARLGGTGARSFVGRWVIASAVAVAFATWGPW